MKLKNKVVLLNRGSNPIVIGAPHHTLKRNGVRSLQFFSTFSISILHLITFDIFDDTFRWTSDIAVVISLSRESEITTIDGAVYNVVSSGF